MGHKMDIIRHPILRQPAVLLEKFTEKKHLT